MDAVMTHPKRNFTTKQWVLKTCVQLNRQHCAFVRAQISGAYTG
ncbi:hypothetical protein P4S73_16135 [Paraglaciecola sp. Hal342]